MGRIHLITKGKEIFEEYGKQVETQNFASLYQDDKIKCCKVSDSQFLFYYTKSKSRSIFLSSSTWLSGYSTFSFVRLPNYLYLSRR
jgi:hypothetical protein